MFSVTSVSHGSMKAIAPRRRKATNFFSVPSSAVRTTGKSAVKDDIKTII